MGKTAVLGVLKKVGDATEDRTKTHNTQSDLWPNREGERCDSGCVLQLGQNGFRPFQQILGPKEPNSIPHWSATQEAGFLNWCEKHSTHSFHSTDVKVSGQQSTSYDSQLLALQNTRARHCTRIYQRSCLGDERVLLPPPQSRAN